MYIVKSSRLTRVIKYCKRTLQCIFCNQFCFLFFLFIIPLILPPLFLLQISHQIFFLAFNYTIVSKLSQLKKITLTYFMCCLKIIFLAVNASNLIKRIPLDRKLKNAINKIYSLAKVSYFLKNYNYSKTAKY